MIALPPKGRRTAWRIGELADSHGLAASTIRDLIRSGRLPAYRVGRALLVKADDWERYLARHRVGGRE
ncbi:MAG: helix-turn-helix domain-containing protein [Planctomycetes bacterium]|nr:helix-turn-helix domain-containing protein [Planctomycetota bacterium]MCB9825802.1 helix-turn-helix domain-containing protein [Planctomycetota bacterium]MCB9829087.1 helix-turn-helix domain-containing protein [Planctomycetota bacterium]MCB9901201.1 helix-turn-helix domain-containing protein [Planctomycetota bacterium]